MSDLSNMRETCLSYEKLAKRVNGRPDQIAKVHKILDEIRSDLTSETINRFGQMIDYTVGKLYDGINFELPKGLDFKKLSEENNIILVPNHQSHADYIGMSYVLWNEYRSTIYIAGGINLNIFPIGPLFRKSGCFFIRRSFNNDILYKLTLESYVYYLLVNKKTIEFFFEGGRSRTGKLLPPRFGFFSMILETYSQIKNPLPLLFIPVSISHEVVPEQKSHVRELDGKKKEKETSKGLLKIFKLMNKKLGTIHIKMNEPIVANTHYTDLKKATQDLAFECYRSVGKGMMVTPTSLLALIMLDEPNGAMIWESILAKSQHIIKYCEQYNVPVSSSLKGERLEKSMVISLDLQIENGKVKVIKAEKLGKVYYAIKEENRLELLYFKNTILHHFLVPGFIFSSWVYVFTGHIKDENDLKKFYLYQRKQMKYEFYLPTIKELYKLSLLIISDCLGRKVTDLSEVFNLTHLEAYSIAKKVGGFSRSYSHIHEGYYIGLLALKHFSDKPFTLEKFLQASKEIFEMEASHGRLIKYRESYSLPLLKNSMLYFENLKLIEKDHGEIIVVKKEEVGHLIEKYVTYLNELLTFNLKLEN